MAKTRLTIALREAIKVKAMSMAFAGRDKDIDIELNALGPELYRAEVPEEVEAAARALGPDWIEYGDTLTVGFEGWAFEDRDLKLGRDVPMKADWIQFGRRAYIEKEHALYPKAKALCAKKDKLDEDKKQFHINLSAILRSVKTIEALREIWPECNVVLPLHAEAPPTYAIVPVSLINDINKALGIPSKPTPITKAMAK